MTRVAKIISELRVREASLSLGDLVAYLRELGFEVSRRSQGNHYTLTHDELNDFFGSNFDGGHAKHVLVCYVKKMRKLIEKYQRELEEILGENNGET